MHDARNALGRRGERLAERFLKKQGLKTVARRYNTRAGEIDLVMRAGQTVVFVEVKTRADRVFADPQDAVNAEKRRRLLKAVRWFLRERGWEDEPCRFDVVAVTLPPAGKAEIEHFPEAFFPER